MDKETLKLIGRIIGLILGYFLSGLITMVLWNYLMPTIFGLTTLTYLQSVCLMVLVKNLFGYNYHIKDKKEEGE
jgi:hypothetical protein